MRRYLGSLLALALAAAPASALAESTTKPASAQHDVKAKPRLGVHVTGLNPLLRMFLGSDAKGVLVTRVEPLSPASRAGIMAGDLLQEVGGRTIEKASDVPEALANVRETVQIKVVRHHQPMTFEVKPDTTTSLRDLMPSNWLRELFEPSTMSDAA